VVGGHSCEREEFEALPNREDRESFEVLFRATYDHVLAYALRRTDAAEAEDIVAETYAVAWRRFAVIPPEPLPWLYAVARRTLANARRSGRRRAELTARIAAHLPSSSSSSVDPTERLEDAAIMRAALRALKESDREALMLVGWDGLNNQEASLVLGVSPEAFAVRLHRARRRLEMEIERRAPRLADDSVAPEER
jgi:RNA polymerase sigma-70 factor (ECF subfamily)